MSAESRLSRILKRMFLHNLGLKLLALALALLVYFSIRAEIRSEGGALKDVHTGFRSENDSMKGVPDAGKQSQQLP